MRASAFPGVLPGGEAGCRDGALCIGHAKPGLRAGPAVLLQLIKAAGLEVQAHCSGLHAVQQLLHLQRIGSHGLSWATSWGWQWPSLEPAQAGQLPWLITRCHACMRPHTDVSPAHDLRLPQVSRARVLQDAAAQACQVHHPAPAVTRFCMLEATPAGSAHSPRNTQVK